MQVASCNINFPVASFQGLPSGNRVLEAVHSPGPPRPTRPAQGPSIFLGLKRTLTLVSFSLALGHRDFSPSDSVWHLAATCIRACLLACWEYGHGLGIARFALPRKASCGASIEMSICRGDGYSPSWEVRYNNRSFGSNMSGT